MSDQTMLTDIATKIQTAKRIAILSHRNPDGDTIGSNVGLRLGLESIGKEVISVCHDTISEKFSLLPSVRLFRRNLASHDIDLVITVDIAAKSLIGSNEEQQQILDFPHIINIDHHPDNEQFGHLNLVDPHAAAAAILIYLLLDFMKIPIRRDIATALLVGLYWDTGSFMHGNTSQEAYAVAAKLVSCGGNINLISQYLFRNFPVNKLKLWGEVLNRVKVNEQQVVSSVVTSEDFDKTGTSSEDLNGLVEYLNMIPNSRYAMLLTEDEQGHQVKGSLRTLNDNVDVSSIAHQFGGGGHSKASGFRISGKLEEEVTWKVVGESNKDIIKI